MERHPTEIDRHPASFRDPSGFIYHNSNGTLLRRVNASYLADYRRLMESGLYNDLVEKALIVDHVEEQATTDEWLVIRPRPLRMISYPYEWAFSALKTAALTTLDVQLRAIDHEMVLKDASAFNVQFEGANPIFIDTLSFESYVPGSAWQAYAQFCRHFVAPLALAASVDMRMLDLQSRYLDGIPLDLANRLLPWRCRLRPGILMHVGLHARLTAKHGDSKRSQPKSARQPNISKKSLIAMLQSLRSTVESLKVRARGTEWIDYYDDNSYTEENFEEKQVAVRRFLAQIEPETVWDLGANTGLFSQIASDQGAKSVSSFDIDRGCVEAHFRERSNQRDRVITPLFLDLVNPSPALGWGLTERSSFVDRGPVDCTLALALIHHLAIANNVTLKQIFEFLRRLSSHLIIEWVPKSDPQIQRLLRSRQDIFADYHLDEFVHQLSKYFAIQNRVNLGDDGRILFLLKGISQSS